MGRKLAPLFFAAFLAYGYNNIFMTLTPSFVVAAGGTLAEAGLQNSVYLAAAVLLRFAFGPGHEAGHAGGPCIVCARGRSVPAVCRVLADAFGALRAGGRPCFFLVVGHSHRFGGGAAPGSGPLARPVSPDDLRFASSGASCGVRTREGRGVRRMLSSACWMLCGRFGLRWRHEAPSPPSVRATSGSVALCEGLVSPVWSCRHSSGRDVCRRHGIRLVVQFWRHLHLSRRNDRKRGMVLHAYWTRGPCGQSRCRYPLRLP